MPNWQAAIHDTLKAAETGIETVDASKHLYVFSFLDGMHQKAGVINGS